MQRARRRIAATLGAILALSSCLPSDATGPDGHPVQTALLIRANATGTLVATVVVQVTALDIATPLLFNIPVTNGVATGTITITAGSSRTITLRAYDAGGVETDTGSVTLNIQAGTNPMVSVVLTPLTGNLPITVTLGSFRVVVQPATATLMPGDTVDVRAIILDASSDTISGQVGWATLNPGVATATSTGQQTAKVTAVGGGQTTVVATFSGVGGTTAITVAVPTLVQHVSTPSTKSAFTTGFNIYLPNKSLPGNCIIVAVQNAPAPGVTLSVSDDQSNTYVAGPAAVDGSGSITLSLFYAVNATAGVQHITVSMAGGSVNYVTAVASEWYDVATSNASDGASHALSTTRTVTWAAGNMTTTAHGDLVYQVAVDYGGDEPYTSFVAESGFALASADLLDGSVTQYQVQRSAGAVNPTVAANASGGYASVAIALRSAVAGTPPGPGIRIVHMYVGNTENYGSATAPTQFPCSGNLLVFTMAQGTAVALTGVADGNGNTYTQIGGSPLANGPGGTVRLYYAANATTSSPMPMTLTFASPPTAGSGFIVYDISGAATSPLDASNTAIGAQLTAGALVTVSLTPAGGGELVIARGDQDFGTITSLVGSGYLFDNPTWVGQDENGSGGAGNEFTLDSQAGHYYTSDASPLTFVWTETRAVDEWETIVAAFKGH